MKGTVNNPHQKATLKLNHTSRQPLDLLMPTPVGAIYDEDHDGLIPIQFLTQPLRVELFVWNDVQPRDTYQIFWNGAAIGAIKEIDTEQVGDVVFLEVPVSFLQIDGTYSIDYEVFFPANGTRERSVPVTVEIDWSAPGRPQLGPMKFPVEIEGGLTSAELTELGDELVAEIGGYTGMYQHDVIRTFWGSVEGPGAVVNNVDMDLQSVLVTYTRAFLESLDEFDGVVTYNVTDRAGNISQPSLDTHVHLLLTDAPDDFPAPVIDPAVGPLVDYAEARAEVTVDIPQYPGVDVGDQITLYWEGEASRPEFVPDGNETEPVILSFTVPYQTIAIKPEGVASVSYEVKKSGQLHGTSLPASIDVFVTLPGPNELDAPLIQGTSVSNPNLEDNFIDEDDYELNSRGIVKWKTGFAINDDLNLYWGEEFIPQWYQIKATDISAARDLNIPIPNETMKLQGTGAQIPVSYTLTRFGNPNPSDSLVQDVIVRSAEDMPGGVDGLDGPTFNTVPGTNIVGPNENSNGAAATIVPYDNIFPGQTLEFTFNAFNEQNAPIPEANYSSSKRLNEDDVINGYVFTVPVENLKRICFGFADAYIKVTPAPDSNQSPTTSRTTRVQVIMRRPGLSCDWL